MSRKWISVLLILAGFSSVHAAKKANVIQNAVPVYTDVAQSEEITRLDFGSPVRIHKQKGAYYYISTRNIKGWILMTKVTLIADKFSNIKNTAILAPDIILENNQAYMYFYTKDNIVKYDIYNRKKVSAYRSGPINNIHSYGKGNKLLVEGVYTNQSVIHNLRILHLDSGQFVNITSYPNNKALFLGGKFSSDGKFLSLQFQVSGKSHIVIFQSESGDYIGTAKNASQFFWQGHHIIFQDGNSLWSVDLDNNSQSNLSYSKTRELIKLNSSEIPRDGLESKMYDGVIYYETKKGVMAYDVVAGKKTTTRLKSLEFDPGMTLNHVYSGGKHRLISIKSKNSYNYFSGSRPRYKFVQFFDDSLVYSKIVEKLDTLFFAPVSDPYSKAAYKYKAIDDIQAYSENGILAEISHDKDLSAIIVEIPQKKNFFVILLKH